MIKYVNNKQPLHNYGLKLIKMNPIHAQTMTIRKQYWIVDLLTSPKHYSSRPSPYENFALPGDSNAYFFITNIQ